MGDPFSTVAIGLGSNILLSLLAPTNNTTTKVGKLENQKAPTAEYGFSIIQPYGRVRIDGCNMFWATDLKERVSTRRRGGKGLGGTGNNEQVYSYYMRCAYLIGGEIQSHRRVWLNSELVYASDYNNPRSAKFTEFWDVYNGDNTQSPSSVIEGVEGIGNVPNFRGYSYAVANFYPLSEFEGSGFPKMDVEVIGRFGENPKVKDIIVDVCKIAGIPENKIDVSDLDDSTIQGFMLKYDGTSYAEQLQQLQQLFFIIAVESKDMIIFKHQPRNANDTIAIPKSSLCTRKFGEEAGKPYQKKVAHPRELATGVSVSFTSIAKDFSTVSITARNPIAVHRNETNISVPNCITDDGVASTLASRTLYMAETQGTQLSKLRLPLSWNALQEGGLIGVDFTRNFQRECYQITRKVLSPDYIVEIDAVKYQGYMNECLNIAQLNLYIYQTPQPVFATPFIVNVYDTSIRFRKSPMRIETTLPLGQIADNDQTKLYVYDGDNNLVGTINTYFGLSTDSSWSMGQDCSGVTIVSGGELPTIINDTQYTTTEEPRTYGDAEVIPFEIALYNPNHVDSGVYVAIKGDDNFRFGTLYSSEDEINWSVAADILTTSTVGEVIAIPTTFNQMPVELIDTNNKVRIRIDSGELDPVTLDAFVAGNRPILIGEEQLLYKDVEIVSSSPLVYDVSYFMRGINGTELKASTHAIGDRVILLDENIIRLPVPINAINRTYYLKAVPYLLNEPEVLTYTDHTVNHESLRPFTCIPVTAERQLNNDIVFKWERRTRVNGGLVDFIDIPFAAGELDQYTFTIESIFTLGSGRTEVITGTTSFVYTVAMQLADWGVIRDSYTVNVFQHSSYPVAPASRESFNFILPLYP